MKPNEQIQHKLTLKFSGESAEHTILGNSQDLTEIVNDLSFYSINALLRSRYCAGGSKTNVYIPPISPATDMLYHFIVPVNDPKQDNHVKPTKRIHIQPAKFIQAKKEQELIIKHRQNREHNNCFIVLQPESTVTCSETGISFKVSLPMPQGANLSIVHPLSFYSNVQELIRAYGKSGLRIESELENQILAGMLLTILRQKALLVCRDYPAANLCLQKAKKETLASAIRYFYSLPSSVFLPQLHIIPEALYDFYHNPVVLSKEQVIADRIELLIANFVKVCQGRGDVEDTSITHSRRDKVSSKIRVYAKGGNAAIESRQVVAREKIASKLLERLNKEVTVSTAMNEMLQKKIDALMFLSPTDRMQASLDILSLYKDNKTAKELANIFATTKTENLENSLLSFSQEMQEAIQTRQEQNAANKTSIKDLIAKFKQGKTNE